MRHGYGGRLRVRIESYAEYRSDSSTTFMRFRTFRIEIPTKKQDQGIDCLDIDQCMRISFDSTSFRDLNGPVANC